jgi:F0F1-type ATP synthase epsilon subunit
MMLKVISPTSSLSYPTVRSLTIDTSLGKIQILPGHIDVITGVSGEMSIQCDQYCDHKVLNIKEGVFIVQDGEWTLLANDASIQS